MSRLGTVILALGLCLIDGGAANAAGTEIQSDIENAKSLSGLCMKENKESPNVAQGYCMSLYERFTNTPCAKDLMEEIRLRFLGNDSTASTSDKEAYKALSKGKDEKPKPMTLGLECNGKDKKPMMLDVAKNPKQFTYLMTQFIATVAIKTSQLDVLNKVPDRQHQVDGSDSGRKTDDTPQGLLELPQKLMKDEKYKCGCEVPTCPNAPGEGEVTVQGECPGPADGHQNIMCGAYIALKMAAEDGVLYNGKDDSKSQDAATLSKPPAERDGRKGAARLFKVLEEDNKDKTSKEGKTTTDFIEQKINTFCEANGPAKVEEWVSDQKPIGLEELKNSPKTNQ